MRNTNKCKEIEIFLKIDNFKSKYKNMSSVFLSRSDRDCIDIFNMWVFYDVIQITAQASASSPPISGLIAISVSLCKPCCQTTGRFKKLMTRIIPTRQSTYGTIAMNHNGLANHHCLFICTVFLGLINHCISIRTYNPLSFGERG